jgi:hypothetical protein
MSSIDSDADERKAARVDWVTKLEKSEVDRTSHLVSKQSPANEGTT